MPVPVRKLVEAYRGDTLGLALVLWEDVAATVPVDLSDSTVTAQVRATVDASSVLAEFAVTTTGNQITLTLTPAQTAVLPLKAVYDVQVDWYSDEAQVQTVLAGDLTTSADVTRAVS
jgi:hypothetical protein